ncbi:MAG: ABC transporter ATP-binding protein [Tissierellia bacterium]|nr:ABC transporter ATP-binding protein [Tissierellia bacterium]
MQLILENIHKSFGDNQVLRGASGSFDQGKIYALLGRNGSGKTTLFDLISEKKKKDQGKIYLKEGEKTRPLAQEDIFYMVASPLLPNFLTGREFIQFFMDVNRDQIRGRWDLEELFSLLSFEKRYENQLIQSYSLGTRNKLQMMMFLLLSPPVILMDEPLTSLDVVVQLQIKKLIKTMEAQHIILFSTHILQLAQDICDDLVILNQGLLHPLDGQKLRDPEFEGEIIRILSGEGETQDV